MFFLAYTHWTWPLCDDSFVLSIEKNMNTNQVVAAIGTSENMDSVIAKAISKLQRADYITGPNKVQSVVGEYPGSRIYNALFSLSIDIRAS